MKKLLITATVAVAIVGLFAFKQTVKKNLAEVEQIEGYYIFVNSNPVNEFTYLGTVQAGGGFGSSQFTDVRDKLIKKTKKEYPKADGIIFHFVTGKADKAEAIMFKE